MWKAAAPLPNADGTLVLRTYKSAVTTPTTTIALVESQMNPWSNVHHLPTEHGVTAHGQSNRVRIRA